MLSVCLTYCLFVVQCVDQSTGQPVTVRHNDIHSEIMFSRLSTTGESDRNGVKEQEAGFVLTVPAADVEQSTWAEANVAIDRQHTAIRGHITDSLSCEVVVTRRHQNKQKMLATVITGSSWAISL